MYSGAKSADRALSVLSFLATRATPTPTMTIARECSIPKSSTHHLLNLMRERNFVTYYEVERAWEWIDGVADAWRESGMAPKPYAAGSWGPAGAFALIERSGRAWYD